MNTDSNINIVKTDTDSINGQDKCPKCGSTDISHNISTGKLRCEFCRFEFDEKKISGMVDDIHTLEGSVVASGASDIAADAKDMITLKCTSCGAEVVIDTSFVMQARCHWCRNTLSINQQIPNGSVPDVVLPFGITKEVARSEIEKFVAKRKFYANPKFKAEFTTENIMGVFFPYMLVDVNAHANLSGEGEHQTKKYTRKVGDREEIRYDADAYHVEREFDLIINSLSVESSSDRLNNASSSKTNNVINSIMPFDTENCVKYNSNYLKGYTSEKRDMNIDGLKNLVHTQAKDIARFAANDTLGNYDRGVAWKDEDLSIKGEQWKAAYLPVWLYSYQEISGSKKILHYVAVNARTKETMGSVPIHMPKLFGISALVELAGIIAMLNIDWDYNFIFLLSGIVYFAIIYSRYRNSGARHTYELETKREMANIRKVDNFLEARKGLSHSNITGANNTRVDGNTNNKGVLKSLNENAILKNISDSDVIINTIKDNINKK